MQLDAQVQEQLQQAQQAQPSAAHQRLNSNRAPETQQAQQPASDEEALRAALERPAVRQALEQQISQVEQAKADYAQKAGAAFDMSYASLLSNFPELRGVNGQQLPAVLNVLQRENPVRHAAVMSALYTTDHLHTQASRAKQAEAIVAAAKTELYGRQQDAAMDQFIAQQPAEERRAVKENIARVASQYYGVQPEQLAEAIRTNPGMRAEPFQRMLYSTVLSHLKNEALAAKRVPPNVPHVHASWREPASRELPTSRDVASALARFNKNPNPKSAADYLNARRAATIIIKEITNDRNAIPGLSILKNVLETDDPQTFDDRAIGEFSLYAGQMIAPTSSTSSMRRWPTTRMV